MDFYRRVVEGRVSEMAGADGLPVDRLMRTLGIRRAADARGRGARAAAAGHCSSASARGSTPPRRPPGASRSRCSCSRLEFEPWRPVDILSLGKLLAFGLSTNWERELLRADMVRELGPRADRPPRPHLPRRQPGRHPGSLERRRARDRRADRRGAALDRPRRRGQRLQQLGRQRRPLGDRLAADRRRPAPAPEHAGHLVRGQPAPRRALRPRRLAARDAGRLHGPEQRRLLDLHQRHGRRPGPLRRADRGRHATCSRTSGGRCGRCARRSSSRAATSRSCSTCASPTTARSSTRRSAPTTAEPLALRWQTLDEPTAFAGMFELLEIGSGPELVAALEGHTSPRLEPDLGRPPRLDRLQADRPPAAAPRRLPRPAEAGLDRRVRVGGDDPLRGAAGGGRPRERLPRHRQQPHRRRRLPAPHHQRVARRLPRQADRAAARGERAPRPRELRGDADRQPLAARARGGARGSAACARAASASAARSSGCAAGTGRLDPGHDRRHDLPGLPAAAGARGGAGGDRRPRPLRALARPRRQRLHAPHHLALALALAPDGALGGGRRGADRPPLGRVSCWRHSPAPSTTSRSASAPTPRAGAGAGCTRWSSRTRSATPTRCCGGCSTAACAPAAPRRP